MADSQDYRNSLSRLSAILAVNKDIPVPYSTFYIFAKTKEDFASIALKLSPCEKSYDDFNARVTKKIGTIELVVVINREDICEKVKVGEMEIPEKYVEASEAKIVPAHTEDIYEWKCPDSFHDIISSSTR